MVYYCLAPIFEEEEMISISQTQEKNYLITKYRKRNKSKYLLLSPDSVINRIYKDDVIKFNLEKGSITFRNIDKNLLIDLFTEIYEKN